MNDKLIEELQRKADEYKFKSDQAYARDMPDTGSYWDGRSKGMEEAIQIYKMIADRFFT